MRRLTSNWLWLAAICTAFALPVQAQDTPTNTADQKKVMVFITASHEDVKSVNESALAADSDLLEKISDDIEDHEATENTSDIQLSAFDLKHIVKSSLEQALQNPYLTSPRKVGYSLDNIDVFGTFYAYEGLDQQKTSYVWYDGQGQPVSPKLAGLLDLNNLGLASDDYERFYEHVKKEFEEADHLNACTFEDRADCPDKYRNPQHSCGHITPEILNDPNALSAPATPIAQYNQASDIYECYKYHQDKYYYYTAFFDHKEHMGSTSNIFNYDYQSATAYNALNNKAHVDDDPNDCTDNPMIMVGDYRYGEHYQQKADIFLPFNYTYGAPLTGIIFYMHGGAGAGGDKLARPNLPPMQYAQCANAIGVNINYRVFAEVGFDGQLYDVAKLFRDIMDQLKDAHDVYNLHVTLTGESSGGYLTAILGTNPKFLNQGGSRDYFKMIDTNAPFVPAVATEVLTSYQKLKNYYVTHSGDPTNTPTATNPTALKSYVGLNYRLDANYNYKTFNAYSPAVHLFWLDGLTGLFHFGDEEYEPAKVIRKYKAETPWAYMPHQVIVTGRDDVVILRSNVEDYVRELCDISASQRLYHVAGLTPGDMITNLCVRPSGSELFVDYLASHVIADQHENDGEGHSLDGYYEKTRDLKPNLNCSGMHCLSFSDEYYPVYQEFGHQLVLAKSNLLYHTEKDNIYLQTAINDFLARKINSGDPNFNLEEYNKVLLIKIDQGAATTLETSELNVVGTNLQLARLTVGDVSQLNQANFRTEAVKALSAPVLSSSEGSLVVAKKDIPVVGGNPDETQTVGDGTKIIWDTKGRSCKLARNAGAWAGAKYHFSRIADDNGELLQDQANWGNWEVIEPDEGWLIGYSERNQGLKLGQAQNLWYKVFCSDGTESNALEVAVMTLEKPTLWSTQGHVVTSADEETGGVYQVSPANEGFYNIATRIKWGYKNVEGHTDMTACKLARNAGAWSGDAHEHSTYPNDETTAEDMVEKCNEQGVICVDGEYWEIIDEADTEGLNIRNQKLPSSNQTVWYKVFCESQSGENGEYLPPYNYQSDEIRVQVAGDGADVVNTNQFESIRSARTAAGLRNGQTDGDNPIGYVINTGGGKDNITTGDGDDTIFSGSGSDIIVTSGGNNIIDVGTGSDKVTAGIGHDQIFAEGWGTRIIEAGDGNNYIQGGSGIDEITTGQHKDDIRGNNGPDDIDSGYGDDVVYGGQGNDVITALGGHNTIYGESGQDTITTGWGDDTIDGGSWHDTINAGDGTNTIYGDSGNDTITTGMGEDEIHGGIGDDIITGGAGNDDLFGHGFHDTYIFNRGDGLDTVLDEYVNTTTGQLTWNSGQDKLFIQNVTRGEVSFRKAGDDLIIEYGNDPSYMDRITIQKHYLDLYQHKGHYEVETIVINETSVYPVQEFTVDHEIVEDCIDTHGSSCTGEFVYTMCLNDPTCSP